MFRKLCAVACILLLSSVFVAVAMAAEPMPGDTSAEVVGAAPLWLDLAETGLNYLWKLAIPAFFIWILKKVGDKEALASAIRSVEAGVTDAWVNLVRDLKAKASDGKLTSDEKEEAATWARNKAMEIAKGPGKKVLVALGELGMNALIEKIVAKKKAGG